MAEVCAVFLWMFLSQSECPVVILLFGVSVRFCDTLHVENGALSALALLGLSLGRASDL